MGDPMRCLDDQNVMHTDTVAVAVLNKAIMNTFFTQKWNAMKSSMASGNIIDTAGHFHQGVRSIYSQQFNEIASSLPLLAEKMGVFNLVTISDYIAECELRSEKDGVNYSFQVLYIRDANGTWGMFSF